MLPYRSDLKEKARQLRKHMTESERVLWGRLRGKQLLGVQFYRQKPIGNYIVDFYAPSANLVIDVDGSQHLTEDNPVRDSYRDSYLRSIDLEVLRFNSREVLKETDSVMRVILRVLRKRVMK